MHSFEQLKEMVSREIENLDLPSEPIELYDPVKYILGLGGKRIRPVITLMSCELFGGDIQLAMKPAIGMEMFHNFTLVHDDIMDKADYRRGHETVHKKWDENRAILSGDAMIILANQLMMHTEDAVLREVMEVYNHSGLLVCDGQQYDMNFETSSDVSIPSYINMIKLKTSALLASCFRLGGVIAKTSLENKNLIEEFGNNLGISFQIKDDFLDSFGDFDKFGKKTGGDILANKKTFLVLKAIEIANQSQRKELEKLYSTNGLEPQEKIGAVLDIFNQLDIQEITKQESVKYFQKALKNFNSLDVAEKRKQPILQLSDFLVGREY